MKYIHLIKYRLHDQDAKISIVTTEPLMKHARLLKLQEIGPTAFELGFEIYEATIIDSGETPPPVVLTERIVADSQARARAEGIISAIREAKDKAE